MINNFNVLFLDKNNLPMVFSRFSQNVTVCIGKDIANYFCNANCDNNSIAHFSVKNMPEGKYYIRGVWKEGYINFTRPLTIEIKNGIMLYNNKEVENNYTFIIKSDF